MSDFSAVISIIRQIRGDEALLEDFLVGLTTDKERRELAQRLAIVKRLRTGEPQAKIASDLGVGVATVTRGSKELAQGRFKILEQLQS